MDKSDFVLCGLGGQGILFMTKILAQAALDKGFPVMGAETHGMAQRGGSVVSHLRLGNVTGSLVRTGSAQVLLALDEIEAYRNLPFLSDGACLFMNADSGKGIRETVQKHLARRDILCRRVAASAIASKSGVPMATNLALIGYFSAFNSGPLNHEDLLSTIEKISPDRFKEGNLKVFTAGYENGLEARG